MPKRDFSEIIQEIGQKDPRYSLECYSFVREGLDHTLKQLKRGTGYKGHVTGQELLAGLRDYALHEFGPMTKPVLNEWGINECQDFGEVVFNLVQFGVFGKNETDSLNDFKDGFNFHDAFVKPFRPQSAAMAVPSPAAPTSQRPRKNKPATAKAKKSGSA